MDDWDSFDMAVYTPATERMKATIPFEGMSAADVFEVMGDPERITDWFLLAKEVRVHPALVPVQSLLASVSGVFNAVMVHGDMSGETMYYGRGAGRLPTASTVLSDIVDVARNLAAGSPCRVPAVALSGDSFEVRSMSDVASRYYLRLSLRDEPGVLARISSVLGEQGISIESVRQKEGRADEYVHVIIVTHIAKEQEIARALQRIELLTVVGDAPVRLRIED